MHGPINIRYILSNLIAITLFSNQQTDSSWISETTNEMKNKRVFSWAVIDGVLGENTIRTPQLIYNVCVCVYLYEGKNGEVIPSQARCGPEGG